MPVSATVKKLERIRNVYTPDAATEKLDLMEMLGGQAILQVSVLERYHRSLCFIRAFPDGLPQHRAATKALSLFAGRVADLDRGERDALDDSGIEGTRVHYRFSFAVALWLAAHCKDTVTVNWRQLEKADRLDELLRQIVLPAEADFYLSGAVTEREWIEQAVGERALGAFRWLLTQLRARPGAVEYLAGLYDAADIPLCWQLGPKFSKGRNALAAGRVAARKKGMRKLQGSACDEVERPMRSLRRLPKRDGALAISAALGALAVRHRETYHFNHANPEEVYSADAGCGVRVLIYGLLQEYRFSLETTMGYLIVANGMPVGYGGASAVFSQANTGINMFEEYRGSEAPYLWVQVLRAYRHLFGCTRFVVNPYQIGAGNPEALKSGAFWFYYRLGFRPADPHIASLAAREMSRINSRRGCRSDVQTLRRLTRCDMQLRLRGAADSDYFNEEWLAECAAGASSVLARQRAAERRAAARQAAKELMETLGTAPVENWARSEREALLRLAPIMSLVPDLENWSRREKADLVRLMRAKGGDDERAYIQRLRAHRRLQRGLAGYCRSRCA